MTIGIAELVSALLAAMIGAVGWYVRQSSVELRHLRDNEIHALGEQLKELRTLLMSHLSDRDAHS